jgi:hypothetical protein
VSSSAKCKLSSFAVRQDCGSDSIAPADIECDDTLFNFLFDLSWLCFTIMERGYLVRGAVTVGKLFHNGDFCFGPAMNKAYLDQETLANYPRIIIDKNALEISKANEMETADEEIRKYSEFLIFEQCKYGGSCSDNEYKSKIEQRKECSKRKYAFTAYVKTGQTEMLDITSLQKNTQESIRQKIDKYRKFKEESLKFIAEIVAIDKNGQHYLNFSYLFHRHDNGPSDEACEDEKQRISKGFSDIKEKVQAKIAEETDPKILQKYHWFVSDTSRVITSK